MKTFLLSKSLAPSYTLFATYRRTVCYLLLFLSLAAFLPLAQAVSPAPPGGYPNFNTAVGDDALRDLDTTNGQGNTAAGSRALEQTTTGDNNTAVGLQALIRNLTGSANTAVGRDALFNNTASFNTALGYQPLFNNTTGRDNVALGPFALYQNTTGNFNLAVGVDALAENATGSNNVAMGHLALFANTADNNTAVGFESLENNTSGTNNTADGYSALSGNTTGTGNTAAGGNALENNTTGSYNTAHGFRALQANQTGNFNAALGPNALAANKGNSNAAFGVNSLFHNTTGIGNIAMGFQAGLNLTTGNNNIDIGNFGVAGEGYTIRIGTAQNRTFIAGIRGAVVSGGSAVYVNASGQLGTNPSSRRFKENIAAMDKKSEAILSLHPVTFHYRDKLDPDKQGQFGLIAEEVAQVNPELVTRDEKGEIYSVRYEAINAMLLNEFLKEHKKNGAQQAGIDKLQATVAQQREEIASLKAALKEQAAQIHLISVQQAQNPIRPTLAATNPD